MTSEGWDVFVSYADADQAWAEWVAWQLESAGYRVLIRAWDSVPGANWVSAIPQGVAQPRRTIALLSEAYLDSGYNRDEWKAALADNPGGFTQRLIPIRIQDVPRPGLIDAIVSLDLFGRTEDEARQELLGGIRAALTESARPDAPPQFPGVDMLHRHPPDTPPFPGESSVRPVPGAHPVSAADASIAVRRSRWRQSREPAAGQKAVPGGRRKSSSAPAISRRRDQALDSYEVADRLPVAVLRRWKEEAAVRQLNEPYLLPVSWEPADPDLVDDWRSIVRRDLAGPARRLAGSWAGSPTELAGSGRGLADVLDMVPTGRLVVLGNPGSGKTALAVRLVLDLLSRRPPGDPVPVLVSLASWNPAEIGLYDWLTRRLALDYPGFGGRAPGRGRVNWARALLDAGMLLLLLDGFDEIADAARAFAISRINDEVPPGQKLVLFSRSGPYRDAIHPATGPEMVLAGAAGITLSPLRPVDVIDYLRRSAGPVSALRWEPIRAALTASPSSPLAEALTTPLMASLARAIYNPRTGEDVGGLPDPRELLDLERFPSRSAVERHLAAHISALPSSVRRRRGWARTILDALGLTLPQANDPGPATAAINNSWSTLEHDLNQLLLRLGPPAPEERANQRGSWQ